MPTGATRPMPASMEGEEIVVSEHSVLEKHDTSLLFFVILCIGTLCRFIARKVLS